MGPLISDTRITVTAVSETVSVVQQRNDQIIQIPLEMCRILTFNLAMLGEGSGLCRFQPSAQRYPY